VRDVDIATTWLPDAAMRHLTAQGVRVIPTGIKHGTITAEIDEALYEITTLRVDVQTHGRHATVSFTKDWHADAARRDFTMNALYANADGTLLDPLGGYADVMAGRVRFIGDAATRIREDALRILRFFRFIAWYEAADSALDAPSLEACYAAKAALKTLSGERIQQEMLKLLQAPNPTQALTLIENGGVGHYIGLPWLHFGEKWPRLLELERRHEAVINVFPARRLCWLVQGDTKALDNINRLWKLSHAMGESLRSTALMMKQMPDWQDVAAFNVFAYDTPIDTAINVLLLAAAQDDRLADKVPDRIAALFKARSMALPLSGHDIQALGYKGKAVGEALTKVTHAWAASGFSLDSQQLLSLLK
jgi:tRNA nucleotidyltransferase/poly(A) polymerase